MCLGGRLPLCSGGGGANKEDLFFQGSGLREPASFPPASIRERAGSGSPRETKPSREGAALLFCWVPRCMPARVPILRMSTRGPEEGRARMGGGGLESVSAGFPGAHKVLPDHDQVLSPLSGFINPSRAAPLASQLRGLCTHCTFYLVHSFPHRCFLILFTSPKSLLKPLHLPTQLHPTTCPMSTLPIPLPSFSFSHSIYHPLI